MMRMRPSAAATASRSLSPFGTRNVSAPASIAPTVFCSTPPISCTPPSRSSSPVTATLWPCSSCRLLSAVVDLEREGEPGGRAADARRRDRCLDRHGGATSTASPMLMPTIAWVGSSGLSTDARRCAEPSREPQRDRLARDALRTGARTSWPASSTFCPAARMMIWPGLTPAFAAGYPARQGGDLGAQLVDLHVAVRAPARRRPARWSSSPPSPAGRRRIRCCSYSPGRQEVVGRAPASAPSTRCSAHSFCISLALSMLTSTK